jgi:hypothetical protein
MKPTRYLKMTSEEVTFYRRFNEPISTSDKPSINTTVYPNTHGAICVATKASVKPPQFSRDSQKLPVLQCTRSSRCSQESNICLLAQTGFFDALETMVTEKISFSISTVVTPEDSGRER